MKNIAVNGNVGKLTLIALVCAASAGLCSSPARDSSQTPSVIIALADDEAIRGILDDWRKHQEKVSYSSNTRPYFDCDARRELLKYDRKAIPYLIKQLARQEATEAYVGSALIGNPNIVTIEQVYEYNRRHKSQIHEKTLARWLLTGTLRELIALDVTEEEKRRGQLKRIDWLAWWGEYGGLFAFPEGRAGDILVPHERPLRIPHISTTTKDGLLDICAVSATYRQMIERAAAEMGIATFIGEHRYMDIIGTVRMKSVTYEEFLYMVGRDVYILGFDYRKTENGYWVGGERRAQPRAILNGWGIKMARTAFIAGEDIPVTIISRGMADSDMDAVARCGSFRIAGHDGSIVKDYDLAPDCTLVPAGNRTGPTHEIELVLNRFGRPKVGEYNIRFRYAGRQTPTMPIEIYPSDSRAARILRSPRPKTTTNTSVKGKRK